MPSLLVASSGGHLKELHRLRSRLRGIDDDVTWVTFDTAQARSLLKDENVEYVRPQESRDYVAGICNLRCAWQVLNARHFDYAVSTGAAIAMSFLPLARIRGTRCHYIESATRTEGPSLTGAALRRVPGISLYSQYPRWADGSWKYRGSVFDGFVVEAREDQPIRRAVVTVGTLESFPFSRLIGHLVAVIPDGVETLWQTGSTPCAELGSRARRALPAVELEEALAAADVVVAHAGVGSALAAVEAGRCPILVPRRASFGEHVDDHQLQIAAELSERGLAIACEPEDISLEVLEAAARRRVRPATTLPSFDLS